MTKKKEQSGGPAGHAASAELLGANSEIGRKLRQYYDGLVSDDVPDRFASLLQQLDRADPAQKSE